MSPLILTLPSATAQGSPRHGPDGHCHDDSRPTARPGGPAPGRAARREQPCAKAVHRPPEDLRWARPALWAILVLATALYAWNLSSVTGNTFYNAAVYSGTKSWKAFFFGALDAGSFITKNGTAVSDYSGLYRLDASDVS